MTIRITDIRVSDSDRKEAERRVREAQQAPLMKVRGEWMHDVAIEEFKEWLDALAVKYGLPVPGKINGETNHYGLTADGKFCVYEPE